MNRLYIIFLLTAINISIYCRSEKQFTLYISDSSYYNKDTKIISIYDRYTNVNDNVYVLLHEYGHYISHLLTGDDKSKEDFNIILEHYKDKYKNRVSRFTLDYTTRELKDYRKAPIQDIINGISRGNIKYIYTHHTNYWDDYKIYQEVFANLYVLYVVGDQKQINELNKIFPGLMTAYAIMLNKNNLNFRDK